MDLGPPKKKLQQAYFYPYIYLKQCNHQSTLATFTSCSPITAAEGDAAHAGMLILPNVFGFTVYRTIVRKCNATGHS